MLFTPAMRKLSLPALLLQPRRNQNYFDRVTAADRLEGDRRGLEGAVVRVIGQALDQLHYAGHLGVSNGIFARAASIIKASCFLCGARTLTGILTPLTEDMTAPTNVNFTNLRYDRRTGLLGDGATTYLNLNRNVNADPQNNAHLAIFGTQFGSTTSSNKYMIGRQVAGINQRSLVVTTNVNSGNLSARVQSTQSFGSHGQPRVVGFIGASRNSSTEISIRNNSVTVVVPQSSSTVSTISLLLFSSTSDANIPADFDNSRYNFYSLGESIDLGALDYIITNLTNRLASAIP